MLSRLDEICIKADLIRAAREENFEELSDDGAYVQYHTTEGLITGLGTSNDDASNTFTARLLLLLESRCLIGQDVYRSTISDVVFKYWLDFPMNADDFIPAFLSNDILRLWRTFCINYEARTSVDNDEAKAKRRLKNYKLKHSRLATCFSTLAYLLAWYGEKGTMAPNDAVDMTKLTPLDRLQRIAELDTQASQPINSILKLYDKFLETTDQPKQQLVELFKRDVKRRELKQDANALGDAIFQLMMSLSKKNDKTERFFRLYVA